LSIVLSFQKNKNMHYRNALIIDLPLIVEIYNSTIASLMVTADTENVTVQSKEEWFYEHNDTSRPLWMIEDDKKDCIGWASFQNFYGRPAYEGTAEVSIYLHETMRGQGYGKKILEYCIEKAPSLNLHTILGYIFAHNEPSIKLFTQAGFEEWACLKDIAFMDERFYSLKIFGRKV
jgi:L-amino acid N-acyltransferase YncA